ncbi:MULTISPECIES: NAD(P)/FAD-dependent oxidoreductase [unclassified Rhodococcus (in: high G+C Gram-positive bacteria)]|uniref:NAD(P)/FAD-dependent oxidoreductase n=1 Tax=unclassified Rhodococcus (in: high G+C Gram-positive bacteria) TaxID=192944 RepID=UPI00163B1723|nr:MULTISPECIES: FAD-dependent oxidoreductase [unclassified Rhodococcus (in: high G+C Gram-positive bacteria)]MBC2639196.1 FAD-dependent oxidoreductase [Rhodococcus sp. 3A]MBC2896060.1 FAD-dependent oxidoreductase [Rhodococcus sp. 4CII]
MTNVPNSVVVLGASLAGLSAVRALREKGYAGRLVVAGSEQSLPYDRPPLSKEFLTGEVTDEDLLLMNSDDDTLDVEWRMNSTATGLVRAPDGSHRVTFDDGSHLDADAVIAATGARARTLPGHSGLTGVHTLRSVDDARALRNSLATARNLVIVGAGFIGAEVASSAAGMSLAVTVVEASPTPLAGPLGTELGAICAGQHAAHGVRLLTGAVVDDLLGDGAVEAVRLGDGTVLPADVVVVGIGAVPNVEWACDSELLIDDGFLTDSSCRTNVPGVYAIGDCARSFDDAHAVHHRSEHWSNAVAQAATVAHTIMATPSGPAAIPYFWSHQYGKMLQFAGTRHSTDEVRFVDGDPGAGSFVATYDRDGDTVGVFAMNNPRLFTRYKKQLARSRA